MNSPMKSQRQDPEPYATIETITPDVAAKYLLRNRVNRPMNAVNLEKAVTELRNGEHMLNGDAIRFNSAGDLIDGQHRLAAVVKTGISIKSFVIRGLSTDCFHTIDRGKRRSFGDSLCTQGEKYYAVLAAAVTLLWSYRNGSLGVYKLRSASLKELNELLEANPKLRESVVLASKKGSGQVLAASLAGFCHYVFSEKHGEVADVFMSQLATGENITSSDAVYWLRERLIKDSSTKAKIGNKYKLALVIKAWNGFITGKPVKNLKLAANEPFPEIL